MIDVVAVEWATPASVIAALGPSAAPAPDDPWLIQCVDAANAAAWRKRRAAGYSDATTGPAPSSDVALGATYWARDLWRERQSTDSFQSFEEFAGFTPTTGAWPQIKKLLGIPRAAVDRAPADDEPVVNPLARRRRRLLRYGVRW